MSKRKYSDREKAMFLLALEANGGNVARTSRETGVPRKTLESWADGESLNADVAEIRHEKREPLADIFERVARTYLDHAEKETVVEKTPGQAAVVAAGIATDKSQLLRQLPTQIIDYRSLTDEQLDRLAAGENPQHVLSTPAVEPTTDSVN